jgi:hypothetical protein
MLKIIFALILIVLFFTIKIEIKVSENPKNIIIDKDTILTDSIIINNKILHL